MGKMSVFYNSPRTNPADVTDLVIPLSYFIQYRYLTPGQTLSLYLVDEAKLSYTDAALMLGKDEATIRLGYLKAFEKREKHRIAESRKKHKRAEPAELK